MNKIFKIAFFALAVLLIGCSGDGNPVSRIDKEDMDKSTLGIKPASKIDIAKDGIKGDKYDDYDDEYDD